MPQEALAPLITRLHAAVESARKTARIEFDATARGMWHAVYPTLSEGLPGLVGAILGRAEAHVVRLASLYALLDCSPLIRPAHLLAALAVWDFNVASVHYIFGDAVGDPVADEIMRALRANPSGLTRTDIRDLFGRNKSGDDIGRALGSLLQQGCVRLEDVETGGRRAERWFAVQATTKTTETTEAGASGGLRSFRSSTSYLDLAKSAPPAPAVADSQIGNEADGDGEREVFYP